LNFISGIYKGQALTTEKTFHKKMQQQLNTPDETGV